MLPSLKEQDNRLATVLAGLTPQDREKPCYLPGGIVPAGNFIDLRLKELALHEWDIRSPQEPDVRLSQECLPSIMMLLADAKASGSLPWAFWPGSRLSTPVRYRFEVAQPIPISFDIAVAGDNVRLEDSGDGPADVNFKCETETFLLLINGRFDPSSTIANGRLAVEGNRELAADFCRTS